MNILNVSVAIRNGSKVFQIICYFNWHVNSKTIKVYCFTYFFFILLTFEIISIFITYNFKTNKVSSCLVSEMVFIQVENI